MSREGHPARSRGEESVWGRTPGSTPSLAFRREELRLTGDGSANSGTPLTAWKIHPSKPSSQQDSLLISLHLPAGKDLYSILPSSGMNFAFWLCYTGLRNYERATTGLLYTGKGSLPEAGGVLGTGVHAECPRKFAILVPLFPVGHWEN